MATQTKVPSKPSLKVGIIGCGDIGTHHARMILGDRVPSQRQSGGSSVKRLLRTGRQMAQDLLGQGSRQRSTPNPGIQDVNIIAAADINGEQLSSFCRTFGVPHAYTDFRELLQDDVDAVLIGTPTYLHAEMTIEAARRGKHVFCEKPMAINSEQCTQMIEETKKPGVVLQIGYVLRFSSERARMRDAVVNGEIGRPVFWREIYNLRSGPGQKWVHDEKAGGGLLWENSHTLDFLRYVLGEPDQVFGIGGHFKPDQTTALDTHGVLLAFPSGDKALFTDSYALQGFGWDRVGCRSNILQMDVIGPKGYIQFPSGNLSSTLTICRYDQSGDQIETIPWKSDWGANGYREELEHFFQCVQEGNPSKVPGEEGFKTIQLVETVLSSMRTGEHRNLGS